MKTCSKCKLTQRVSNFRKDKSRKDGLNVQCKSCLSTHHKQYYLANKETSDRIRRNTRTRSAANKAKIVEYVGDSGCTLCDENEYCCLEFHHLDPATKLFEIGSGINRSWKAIETELTKCIILCSNCHKKHHAGLLDLPNKELL